MLQAPASERQSRLLVVAPQDDGPSLDWARLAADLGMRWVGLATDCNDGLRLTLMTHPEVIVLLWTAEVTKLLEVLDYLRGPHFAPRIWVVTNPSAPPESVISQEGVATVEADPLHAERLLESVYAALAGGDARFRSDGASRIHISNIG